MGVRTRSRLAGAALAAVAGLLLTGCGGDSPAGCGLVRQRRCLCGRGLGGSTASGRTPWVLGSTLMITLVRVSIDLTISGPVARFGRGHDR